MTRSYLTIVNTFFTFVNFMRELENSYFNYDTTGLPHPLQFTDAISKHIPLRHIDTSS